MLEGLTRIGVPVAALLGLLLAAAPAAAQDDEDLLPEEETEDEPAPDRLDRPDDVDLLDDEEELDLLEGDPLDDETDLLGDEEEIVITGPGVDSAEVYRSYAAEVRRLAPDEEIIAWEQYLDQYPRSLFLNRIEKRIDELSDAMYSSRISRDEVGVDAAEREIYIAQGMMLEPLNPRQRAQVGFEWGLPDYMNLFADYEHQLIRELSVHGGVRRRFTGWSVESGVRWAFVKASRTQTVVSLIGDVRVNTDPAFLGLRPQLAAGKKFGDMVDLQVQAGVDLDTRPGAGVPIIGGANLTIHAADNVGVFAETQAYMKFINGGPLGSLPYRFNTSSFGLRFLPTLDTGDLEVNIGASVPYTSNYWMFHFGSIMLQVNYFL